ncbi:hypothetical protein QBC43DRAFT_221101 [Cladorrhinum sp. PSN259]|nr:hypothetical protein QBC43DRAFT_221101 [Cladorrhinum sp. PSN259]
MSGTLVPPWYQPDPPSENSLDLASFFWGFAMSIACFAFIKGAQQSRRCWVRSHKINAYIVMIWLEWSSCVVLSIISWLFLIGIIPISIWILLAMRKCSTSAFNQLTRQPSNRAPVFLWAIQIQCLTQILVNRISLVLFDREFARRLKFGVGVAIGLVTISVFCIWAPARLQISQRWMDINRIWDRVEKALFLIIDASLNIYFMRLVRTKLIANGLTKYKLVYKFNIFMVCISIGLDVLIVGIMSLDDDTVYMQVHPLTYLAKLHIEMNMAELLGKVIKKSNERRTSSMTGCLGCPAPRSELFNSNWNIKGNRHPLKRSQSHGQIRASSSHHQRARPTSDDILDNPWSGLEDDTPSPGTKEVERDIEAEGGLGGLPGLSPITETSDSSWDHSTSGRKESSGSSTTVVGPPDDHHRWAGHERRNSHV